MNQPKIVAKMVPALAKQPQTDDVDWYVQDQVESIMLEIEELIAGENLTWTKLLKYHERLTKIIEEERG